LEMLPREIRDPLKILVRLDPARRQLVLVEERAVVGNVRVGPLDQPPHALELIVAQLRGRQPLGALELLEPPEGRLALEPLVEREEDVLDQERVHPSPLSAWWSSSSACSAASVQSN